MDVVLCDDLLQDIFHRLPPLSCAAVSLVSRGWRHLFRSSTTSLCIGVRSPCSPATVASIAAFLAQHPYLSSLTISGGSDNLLLAAASSCPHLRYLRCLSSSLSTFSLYFLSASCVHISSITIAISRPLSFHWLLFFKSLKSLSLCVENPSSKTNSPEAQNDALSLGLNLESLSLCGISPGDYELGFLWENCKNLKKLKFKRCESLGHHPSFSKFLGSLSHLQELELRACRNIVDVVLLTLVKTRVCLDYLSIHDGGSKEGLLQFINQSRCSLKSLDLRLPLDLKNSHLTAMSENSSFKGLVSLRMQSCNLGTGDGLKSLWGALADSLVELALVNCDVLNWEPGCLTDLGQSLRKLRKLDLSYNDMSVKKEVVGMLASCCFLIELRLRGCVLLGSPTVGSIVRWCRRLECVDITYCSGIEAEDVDFLVRNLRLLRRVEVEESKISEFASSKCIEFAF